MKQPGEVMVGRRARPGVLRVAVVVAVLTGATIGGAYLLGRTSPPPASVPPPATTAAEPSVAVLDTANAFLDAWEAEDWKQLQLLIADQSLDAAAVHERANASLRVTAAEYEVGAPSVDGDEATVPFEAAWQLDGLGQYEFDNTLRLERSNATDTGWAVRWWYSTVHPDLSETTRFERTRVFPTRAPILDADGRPLVTSRKVVVVSIQPARVSDAGDVRAALRQHTDAKAKKVNRILRGKGLDPNGLYPVAELRPSVFDSRRPQLFPVDGLLFRREQRRKDHSASALSLTGSLGPITAEQLDELGEPYTVEDRVGQTGLERAFEEQLAGTPALEAAITDDVGLVRSLRFRAGTDPQPLQMTVDLRAQRSAQRALRKAPAPAALVAIDARTGGVRAAAFTPTNGFNRAFSGLYAPGSTFKVVTSYAALADGRTASSRVNCPGRIRVADRFISNDGGAAYGRVTLRRALAVSCNTTYARLGARLGAAKMLAAAELFGFNDEVDFTLPAATPQFPRPTSLAEITRASIGQGRVQVNPLTMASVAATVASGEHRPPTLVAGEPAEPDGQLEARPRRHLKRLMRAVVRSGTGRAADLPGTPVFGKTGTAEFGDGTRTHAWFIGFRDDLAFAVVVEGAGHGGAVAAPVARDFLTGLRDR